MPVSNRESEILPIEEFSEEIISSKKKERLPANHTRPRYLKIESMRNDTLDFDSEIIIEEFEIREGETPRNKMESDKKR
jgi:hypothetical protein